LVQETNPVFVEFSSPKGIDFLVDLTELNSSYKTQAITQQDSDTGNLGVICPLQKLGTQYRLQLFAKKSEHTGMYDQIGELIVSCEAKAVLNTTIPKYRIWFGPSIMLVSHSSTFIVNRESARNDLDIVFAAKKGCYIQANLKGQLLLVKFKCIGV
jgi:hypothetical protein